MIRRGSRALRPGRGARADGRAEPKLTRPEGAPRRRASWEGSSNSRRRHGTAQRTRRALEGRIAAEDPQGFRRRCRRCTGPVWAAGWRLGDDGWSGQVIPAAGVLGGNCAMSPDEGLIPGGPQGFRHGVRADVGAARCARSLSHGQAHRPGAPARMARNDVPAQAALRGLHRGALRRRWRCLLPLLLFAPFSSGLAPDSLLVFAVGLLFAQWALPPDSIALHSMGPEVTPSGTGASTTRCGQAVRMANAQTHAGDRRCQPSTYATSLARTGQCVVATTGLPPSTSRARRCTFLELLAHCGAPRRPGHVTWHRDLWPGWRLDSSRMALWEAWVARTRTHGWSAF